MLVIRDKIVNTINTVLITVRFGSTMKILVGYVSCQRVGISFLVYYLSVPIKYNSFIICINDENLHSFSF